MGFLRRMSLQQSLTVRVAAAVIVIFAFIAYLAVKAMDQSTDLVFQDRVTLADTLARHVDLVVGGAFDQLQRLAASPEIGLPDGDLATKKQLLRVFQAESGTFLSITLIDSKGVVLWTEPYAGDLVGKNVGSTPYAQKALQSGAPAASEVADVKGNGQATVSLVVPIRRGSSQIVGAVIGDFEVFGGNSDIVPALNIGPGYYAEILNENGIVIASTRYDQILRRSSHTDLIAPLVKAGQSGVRIHSVPGDQTHGTHIVAVSPISLVPWVAVIEQSKDAALLLPQQLQQTMLLGGVVALLLVSLLIWLSIRNLVRPIKMLTSASEKIASGDLTIPVTSKRYDEIGILARSFEAMRTKLKDSLEEVERWNRELQDRVHHRTKELSALVEASKALTSTHDLDVLFGLIMAQTRDILQQADAGVLRLYNPGLDRLVVASSFGFSQEPLSKVHLKPGEGLSGKVFRFGKPLLYQSVEEMAAARQDVSVENKGLLEEATSSLPELRSVVGVPLVSKNVTLGSLVLYSFQSHGAFAHSDVELLRAFADQIAIAIENTRLIGETQEKASQIMVINEITKAINSSLDLHQVFHTIASETRRFIGFDVACIVLLDEQNQKLQIFELGVSGSVKLAMEYDLSRSGIQEEWLLDFHRAILARETLIAKDLMAAGKVAEETIFLGEGVKSVVRLPLISGHDVFGAFSLGSKDPSKYSRRDLQTLEQIAAEIAIAVRNAHLFSQSVTQSLNLEATIDVLTDGLMTVGQDLRILSLNPSGEKLLGWRSDELRGEECAPIICAVDEEGKNICQEACLKAQILSGTDSNNRPIRVNIKRRNGDPVPCVINTGVARNSQGEITHFIHTFRDISEEVKNQKEIQQRIKELSGLHAISQAFSSLTDVQETYGQLTGRIADLIGARKCLIALHDQEAGEVVGQAPGYGVSARQIQEFRCRVDQSSLEDLVVPDDGELPILGCKICHDTFAQVFRAQDVLTVPTKMQGRITGFIYAADKLGGFTPDDVKLLTIFAGQAATVIDKARLFDRIRKRLEELHRLYKVDAPLRGSLDLDEILNAILDAQLYDQVQSRAVRDERDRIAREMHDGLSQVLGYLNLQTKAVDYLFEQGRSDEAKIELQQMRKIVKEAYEDVRESIFSLRTSSSPGLSLVTALTEYIHEFSQQNKIRVELVVDEGAPWEFGPSTQIQLIRVIQEALTNVRKHAQTSKALVRFEIDGDRARVTVEDEGKGFDLAKVGERQRHFGLQTMRERAESIGGSLDIESREDRGTRVTISLPLVNKGGGGNGVDKNPSGGRSRPSSPGNRQSAGE